MRKKVKGIFKKNYEIISYLFWGVLTTIVSWGTYCLFIKVFGDSTKDIVFGGVCISINVFCSNAFSWVCAVLFAFFTNKMWVFNSRSWKHRIVIMEFLKFVSSRLLTGICEMVAVPLCVSIGLNQTILGIEGMMAKIVVSLIIVILNYVCCKFIVFSGHDKMDMQ